MELDLFRPVPEALAPAFSTKKTSSVGGYLRIASAKDESETRTEDSPDHGLVEDGVNAGAGNDRQGRIRAYDVVEGIIIDVERLRRSLLFGESWREKDLKESERRSAEFRSSDLHLSSFGRKEAAQELKH